MSSLVSPLLRVAVGKYRLPLSVSEIAEENPDLPLGLVKDILISQEEASAGDVTDYDFG